MNRPLIDNSGMTSSTPITPSAPPPDAHVTQLADLLLTKKWRLATAESCTGGMIAAACTDLAGSSLWFERGFVTYSNDAKMELLGVEERILRRAGAVCQGVAKAMALGAIAQSHAQVAVAVTGVAGPTGGSPSKPVGTVWFGFALPGQVVTEKCHFDGDRAAVRSATQRHAIIRLIALLQCATAQSILPSK